MEIYRLFVRAIQTVWTSAVIAAAITDFEVIVQGLLIPFLVLCLASVYLVGRIYCMDLVDTSTQTTMRDPKYIEHFAMIRGASTRIAVLLAIVMVLVLGSIPMSFNWKEYSPNRGMSAYSTLIQIIAIILTLLLGTILNYSVQFYSD